jgi:transposase
MRVARATSASPSGWSCRRTGSSSQKLPKDFPKWNAVRSHFDVWKRAGRWERINTALRERARRAAGREPTPPAGIRYRQRVTTSEADGARSDEGEKGDRAQAARRRRHAGPSPDGDGDTGRWA